MVYLYIMKWILKMQLQSPLANMLSSSTVQDQGQFTENCICTISITLEDDWGFPRILSTIQKLQS